MKSLQKSSGAILQNRFVLYFILFVAISDLLVLAVGGEYIFMAIFLLSGYLTTFFSKNMTVVLIIAVVLTNILRSGSKAATISEGLENGIPESNAGLVEKPEEELPDVGVQEQLENENDEEVEGMNSAKKEKPTSTPTATPKPTKKEQMSTLLAKETGANIEGLEGQTNKLIDTQKKLMANMKTLEPMLSQAEQFMKQFQANK
jgi:hypothetical protein